MISTRSSLGFAAAAVTLMISFFGMAPSQGRSTISTQFGFRPIGYSVSLVSLPLAGSIA